MGIFCFAASTDRKFSIVDFLLTWLAQVNVKTKFGSKLIIYLKYFSKL